MANERRIDVIVRALNLDRLLDRAVLRKFGRKEDGDRVLPSYIRALTEATMDVKLTPEDYDIAARGAHEAYEKRMAKRGRKE